MELTHLDREGQANMVDVSRKPVIHREAVASGAVYLQKETLKAVKANLLKKGDVLAVARIAAIGGAKKTFDLIPLCHNIPINKIDVSFELLEDRIAIRARAVCDARTGIEMEALTAVSVAALTIYDMCKAVDKGMVISDIKLEEKRKGERMNFTIDSINISERKGVQKKPIEVAECIENHGIKGDAHAGKWHRQISFLSGEAADTMRARAGELKIKNGDFGENVVTRGIDWTTVSVGGKVIIGDVQMEITQIGKECHTRCAIYDAVGDCIMPRQGVFAKVIKGGTIHAGDSGYYCF